MRHFLWGALTAVCLAIALHFAHSWRVTQERLLLFFSAAFGVLSLNWLGLAIIDPASESVHALYLLRLLAFVLIVVGIVDKNQNGHVRS